MKKRIAFFTRQMKMGGVERALVSLLCALNPEEYEIYVFTMFPGGELLDEIPSYCHVELLSELQNLKKYFFALLNGKHYFSALRVVYSYIMIKLHHSFLYESYYLSKALPKIQQHFDFAISYHSPGDMPVFFTINNVRANNHFLWIHGDVEQTKSVCKLTRRYYRHYDQIICVSSDAQRIFVRNYPELQEKVKTVYNIIDIKRVRALATDPIEFDFAGPTICTVARLSIEKGIDIAISACALLKRRGYETITWIVCGDGELREALDEKIADEELSQNFVLLGTKENPYPYIKNSDIYVQPSRHEGYCLTLAEARILCKPIVATKFSGSLEQIQDGYDGLLCECSPKDIADKVELLLKSPELSSIFSHRIGNINSVDNDAIEKIDTIFKEF